VKSASLRFRLTLWYAAIFTAVAAGLAALLVFNLRHYLENSIGDAQARRAHQIAETLVARVDATGEGYLAQQIDALYAPEKSDRFIRITRSDGRVAYLSGAPADQSFNPAAVPAAPPTVGQEFNRPPAVAGQAPLLVAAVRTGNPTGPNYLIEVGTSAAPVDALFRHVLWLLGLSLPGVIALAAAGGYVLIGRPLNLVDRIAAKAEEISQHNLDERLPVSRTGDELERLSLSLNHMIGRLDDAFQNSKRFVADASHELRTPLTILRGELEELAQDRALSAPQRERLGSLLEEVERLTKIVERLFALSRLDAGEAQAERVKFDLAELAIATAAQLTLLAEDRSIALTWEAPVPVWVEGDRARLKQVVVNLLDNAIKYTPDGGSVRLEVLAAEGRAVLAVGDTGIGISADALPHVFDRFFRADKARSRRPDGAGLGLAIVKSICHAHLGEVDAVSVAGKGSRFRVRLPLASP
jgi:heavy metal sensor kinase